MWFNIIKMPPKYTNPYLSESGKKQTWKFLTREQYYEMNNKNKNNYHSAMATVYGRQLNSLRARHQPLAAAPETLQNELIDLQKLRNFHGNQVNRIKNNRAESVFSIEEDKNPPTDRLQTTPMGNIQSGEWDMTEEEYNAATREEKMKYHSRQGKSRKRKGKEDNASKLVDRMRQRPNYTAPYNPEDAKSREEWQKTLSPPPSKGQYENMSNDDKRKFHTRMRDRYKKSNEKDLYTFHNKMGDRLKRNSQLPTYYSIEEERDA